MRFKLASRCLLFSVVCVSLSTGERVLNHALAAHHKPQIAFTHYRHGDAEIYSIDAGGRNRKNLTNNPALDAHPDWSPDGTKIAFASNRKGNVSQIYVMNADGTNPVRVTDGPLEKVHPSWSPDARKIAFTVTDAIDHIAVMDAHGNNLEVHEGHGMEPSWSPDGGEIAFVSWRDGGNEIYVIGAGGRELKRVTQDLAQKWSPSFSPDGRRIAFMGKHEGFLHIFVVGVDGSNRNRLTRGRKHHGFPTWSPDGHTIAYVIANDNLRVKSTMHLMTADGKYLKQLSHIRNGGDYEPDISPLGLAVFPASDKTTTWGRLKILTANPHSK